MSERTVGLIMTTPVKSMAIHFPEEVELTMTGVPDDRQFFLIDDRDRLFVGRRHGRLVQIRSRLEGEELGLEFPDGTVVRGEPELGEETSTDFYELRMVAGKEVRGPFAEALSDYTGSKVRLIKAANRSPMTRSRRHCCPGRRSTDSAVKWAPTLTPALPHALHAERLRGARGGLLVEGAGRRRTPGSRQRDRQADAALRGRHPGPRHRRAIGEHAEGVEGYRGLSEGNRWIVFGVYASVLEPGRVRLGDPVVPV